MSVHVSFMIYAISLFVHDKGGEKSSENSVLHMYICVLWQWILTYVCYDT